MESTVGATIEASRSTDVAWFESDIAEINLAFRDVLEGYSNIAPDMVKPHVISVRDKAWQIFPYPCMGLFQFLVFTITKSPCYNRIVAALKEPGTESTLLDIGCCFGQDVRKLVHDGAPPDNLFACDLECRFIELGYQLFADRDSLRAHFFTANVLEENGALKNMEGNFDFIHLGSLLHLFTLEDQSRACEQIAKLLKPQSGSTVCGRQIGNVEASSVVNGVSGGTLWQHDPRSFEHMWQVIGEKTGTEFEVTIELEEHEAINGLNWEGLWLNFEVTRIS